MKYLNKNNRPKLLYYYHIQQTRTDSRGKQCLKNGPLTCRAVVHSSPPKHSVYNDGQTDIMRIDFHFN